MNVSQNAKDAKPGDRSLSTGQAGKLLGVTSQTIRAYIERGHLKAFTLPSGKIRVHESEVIAYRDGLK